MGTLNPTHLLTHSFCQHGLCLSKQCTNCSPTNSADDVRLLNRRVAVVSASCRCTCSAITGLARSSRRRRHHCRYNTSVTSRSGAGARRVTTTDKLQRLSVVARRPTLSVGVRSTTEVCCDLFTPSCIDSQWVSVFKLGITHQCTAGWVFKHLTSPPDEPVSLPASHIALWHANMRSASSMSSSRATWRREWLNG